jgi:FkbM family methyltransferase
LNGTPNHAPVQILMPFISYAKNYEDVILYRVLGHVEKGFYVDVGAGDAKEYSVTHAFYERGWSGINIEPSEEYFDRLVQDRPRDTNLKIAVGRETGLCTFHDFPWGLSTLDPKIGALHQAAGLKARVVLTPVITLTKILEDCGALKIHFLKIDTEGTEASVLEGLNLDRLRPWIIVVDATEPNSRASLRKNWEHLITDYGYQFAYFDGLNCFYLADEVSELKERLSTPPNVFDNFVRWTEWSSTSAVARLEREVAALQRQGSGLGADLKTVQVQTVNLHNALLAEQVQTAGLHNALLAEQARTASLSEALRAECAERSYMCGRIRQFEAVLETPSADRAIGRLLRLGRDAGNRITGGGVRALAKWTLNEALRRLMRHPVSVALSRIVLKPFPRLPKTVYQIEKREDGVAALLGPVESPTAPPIPPTSQESASEFAPQTPELPPSAKPLYLNLQAAMRDSAPWRRLG